MKKIFLGALLTVYLLVSGGCGVQSPEPTSAGKILVATTIYPLYDFANKIGGERIRLVNLIPPGVEAHDWEPGVQTLVRLNEARVLIYNGLGMEPWLEKVLEALENPDLIVVNASEGWEAVAEKRGEEPAVGQMSGPDPHIWLDPVVAVKMAQNIKEGLVKADPSRREYYEANYRRLAEKLRELDMKFRAELAGVSRREIVVSHAAFGHLARRYGLKQIPIMGLAPDAEPSPARLAELAKLCREKGIKYIFFEELASPRVSRTLAREVGAEVLVLDPLEALTREETQRGRDYFSVMEENLDRLKKALE